MEIMQSQKLANVLYDIRGPVLEEAKRLEAKGHRILKLNIGNPQPFGFETPPEVLVEVVRNLPTSQGYSDSQGILSARTAVVQNYQERGIDITDVDDVWLGNGVSELIQVALNALLDEGDEVIIPAPYWVSYPDMAYLAGAVPVTIPTTEQSGFKITPGQLKKAITPKTKMLILNSPSNPTGASYSRDDLAGLAQVVMGTDIIVVSDEIYEKLVYDGFTSTSIVTVEPRLKAQTIIVNGVSKTYSMTGWRIGYAAGPAGAIKAMANIQSQSTSNPASFAQKGAVEAIQGPQGFINEMVDEFDRRRTYMVARLNAISDFSCLTPNGAFYAFPNVSGVYGKSAGGMAINNSNDFAAYLLGKAGVAVVAGGAFGADNNIRLSYATSMGNIEKGLDRIEKAVEDMK